MSRVTQLTYGGGTAAPFTDGSTATYAYYPNDDLQTLTHAFPGGGSVTASYTYNGVHQQTGASLTDSSFQYLPGTGTLSYGAATPVNGYVGTTYDGNYNRAGVGPKPYTFDVENRLTSAVTTSYGTATYAYDPLGNRKTSTLGTTHVINFMDDGQEEAEYTDSWLNLLEVVRGVGGQVTATLTYTGTPGKPVYYHNDWHGSPMAATQGGKVTAKYTYGPFGEHSAAAGTPMQFTGQRYDYEMSIYYLHARYYDPAQSRFFSFDPIGLKGGNNLYAYVGNDPLNLTDPSGLIASEIGHAVGNLLTSAAQGVGNYAQEVWNTGGQEAFNNPLGTAVSAVQSYPIIPGLGAVGEVGGAAEAAVTARIGATGAIGEDALKALGGQSQVYFSTSLGARYVDQLARIIQQR